MKPVSLVQGRQESEDSLLGFTLCSQIQMRRAVSKKTQRSFWNKQLFLFNCHPALAPHLGIPLLAAPQTITSILSTSACRPALGHISTLLPSHMLFSLPAVVYRQQNPPWLVRSCECGKRRHPVPRPHRRTPSSVLSVCYMP